MKTLTLLLTLILSISIKAQTGTWRNYLSYHTPTAIESTGNVHYILASGHLYTYNTADQSTTTYDKVTGLNSVSISHIKWNNATRRLLIVYSDFNIDLLSPNGDVNNISDYYNTTAYQDKSVYHVLSNGINAYLSTQWGIIKINLAQAQISESYNLGFRINYTYIQNDSIYALSSTNGRYGASLNSNLINRSSWRRIGSYTPNTTPLYTTAQLQDISPSRPGGPTYDYFEGLRIKNNFLLSVGGGYDTNRNLSLPAAVQRYNNGTWTLLDETNVPLKTSFGYNSNTTIDTAPNDLTHIFVGGRTGLYEFRSDTLYRYFNTNNSPLRAVNNGSDPTYVLVESILTDNENELWLLNSYSPTASLFKYNYTTNTWTSYHRSSFIYNTNTPYYHLTSLIKDSHGLLWWVSTHGDQNAIFCYNPETDVSTVFNTFVNQDGTAIANTHIWKITEDNNSDLWISSLSGPLLLRRTEINKGNNAIFIQPKIARNDGTSTADYLLADVNIRATAVDGANRKWFATYGDGVYLVNADNDATIHHFTIENSPLLSNNVYDIAIDNESGEVYMATDAGLCSYFSDATTPATEMTKNSVRAYPNPVLPNYTGLITIKGLTQDADIKITSSNGTLVTQGRSNGGTFTWNGTDLQGKRVISGIYMVQTATDTGKKGTVCKIAVIR